MSPQTTVNLLKVTQQNYKLLTHHKL